MTSEIVISTIILLVCIAPVIIIGIVQYRSKDPAGFWSGKEPPKNLCVIEMTGGIIAMIVYHKRLDRMYYKKEGDNAKFS